MRHKRLPYTSGTTHRMLRGLPGWIRKDASSRLYQTLNTVGMESDLLYKTISDLKLNMNPLTMDPSITTNITRVYGIPSVEGVFTGLKGTARYPLQKVGSEQELLYNLPTSLESVKTIATDLERPLISFTYLENLDSFVALTDHHPADNAGGIFTIDLNGSVVSNTPIGISEQSYDALGFDEEAVFDQDLTATLAHAPFSGTLNLYDILNLTDDQPTLISPTRYTLSGKTITWTDTDNPPNSRYIAEYSYALYNHISALHPIDARWNIGVDDLDNSPYVQYVTNDAMSYTPPVDDAFDPTIDHTVSGNANTRNLTISGIRKETVDDTTSYYLQLNPLEIRSGRTASIELVGTKVHPAYDSTLEWTLNAQGDNDFVLAMDSVDPDFIETAVGSITVYDAADKDITGSFMIGYDFVSKEVTVKANSDFAGQTLHLTIYYTAYIRADLTVTSTTDIVDMDGVSIYGVEVDVSPLVNQSMVIPEVHHFTASCPVELLAMALPPTEIGFNDRSFAARIYLERHNSALHYKEQFGGEEYVILLNLTEDPDNEGVYKTDIEHDLRYTSDGTLMDYGVWEYRDMIVMDEYLVLLSTSVVDSGDYINYCTDGYGSSRIDLYNMYTRKLEKRYTIPTNDAVSLTLGPNRQLYVASYSRTSTSTYNTTIEVYNFRYDYILLVPEGDTFQAFVRPLIDTLEITKE